MLLMCGKQQQSLQNLFQFPNQLSALRKRNRCSFHLTPSNLLLMDLEQAFPQSVCCGGKDLEQKGAMERGKKQRKREGKMETKGRDELTDRMP